MSHCRLKEPFVSLFISLSNDSTWFYAVVLMLRWWLLFFLLLWGGCILARCCLQGLVLSSHLADSTPKGPWRAIKDAKNLENTRRFIFFFSWIWLATNRLRSPPPSNTQVSSGYVTPSSPFMSPRWKYPSTSEAPLLKCWVMWSNQLASTPFTPSSPLAVTCSGTLMV